MTPRVATSLIEGAGSRAEVEEGLGDGAYDSAEIYEEWLSVHQYLMGLSIV
ncbi:hypothetical protein GF326_02895 [Candidatus Bathyarchaeota archaeon]|nr:hypothetical protein [Candidatus Bathyarchaeota archaeon]